MKRTKRLCPFALALLLAAPAALAQDRPGDAEAGRALALRACARCHAVGDAQAPQAGDAAPTFRAIARNPESSRVRLRTFLTAPHGAMPDLSLTTREIDDVTAYILSLPRQ